MLVDRDSNGTVYVLLSSKSRLSACCASKLPRKDLCDAAGEASDHEPGQQAKQKTLPLHAEEGYVQSGRRPPRAGALAHALATGCGWLDSGIRPNCREPVPPGETDARETPAEKESDRGKRRGRNDHRANNLSIELEDPI